MKDASKEDREVAVNPPPAAQTPPAPATNTTPNAAQEKPPVPAVELDGCTVEEFLETNPRIFD